VQKDKIQDFIERALQGDQSACRDLVKRYERGIFNMIYQMVKNREEAEDLVQETFIKAFNALESYNNQFAFSTWLYKIAFNNCIDSIRKHKLKTYPLDRPIETREGSEMLFLEKRKQINQAIRCLPEKYKRVILLRHQEEKTYEEIADIMHIPLGTVKARIFRAREMLKRCIKE
jgi:RNA polymerase sigma factor (sigma-70 family)